MKLALRPPGWGRGGLHICKWDRAGILIEVLTNVYYPHFINNTLHFTPYLNEIDSLVKRRHSFLFALYLLIHFSLIL